MSIVLWICSRTPFVSVNRNNTLMFPDKYLEVTVLETKHELNMRGTCLFTTSPVSQMEWRPWQYKQKGILNSFIEVKVTNVFEHIHMSDKENKVSQQIKRCYNIIEGSILSWLREKKGPKTVWNDAEKKTQFQVITHIQINKWLLQKQNLNNSVIASYLKLLMQCSLPVSESIKFKTKQKWLFLTVASQVKHTFKTFYFSCKFLFSPALCFI